MATPAAATAPIPGAANLYSTSANRPAEGSSHNKPRDTICLASSSPSFLNSAKNKAGAPNHSEHIFGILVDVQVLQDGHWHSRPLPKTVFAEVQELIENNRWNRAAATLCKPRREAHSSGSRSDS